MTDDFFLPHAHAGQRIGVLIDTTDMYHAARTRFGGRLDYRRLVGRIVGPRVLVQAIAFVMRADDVDMRPFLDALVDAGITPRIKQVHRASDGPRGAWDVGIALAAAQLIGRVDAIALVSGNERLADVAAFVRAHGVTSEVYGIDTQIAPGLIEACDLWRAMGEDWLLPGRRRRHFDDAE